MSFTYPVVLILLLVPFMIYIKSSKKSITLFGYTLTLALLVIAISRPVVPQEPIEIEQNINDVVLAIDLSRSMQCQDISPNRLLYAKEILKEIVQKSKDSRFAIVGFTTNAIILSPLSQDKQILLHLFDSLDENHIISKGSSLLPALKLARESSKSKNLSVVIFSDGGDELDYDEEVYFAKSNSMVVNIFMVATKMGGTLDLSDGGVLKDEAGDIVITRENSAIKAVSDETGGIYTQDLNALLDALKEQNREKNRILSTFVQNIELFYYFVALALVIFVLSSTTLKRYILAFGLLFGLNLEASSNQELFDRANRAYIEGRFEEAYRDYEMIKSTQASIKALIYYNMANTLVKLQDYKRAKDMYIRSLTLEYTQEANANLAFVKKLQDQPDSKVDKKHSKSKQSLAKEDKQNSSNKEGGGSNLKVDAPATSGGEDGAKEVEAESLIDLKATKAKLSSKQYELINKREINEKKPW